jgi:hypothetical protein
MFNCCFRKVDKVDECIQAIREYKYYYNMRTELENGNEARVIYNKYIESKNIQIGIESYQKLHRIFKLLAPTPTDEVFDTILNELTIYYE